MDGCIHNGVSSTETTLPGRMRLRRRAPMLYRRLMRGFYPGGVGLESAYGRVSSPSNRLEVDSPEDIEAEMLASELEQSAQDAEKSMRTDNVRSSQVRRRAPRVVGAFDHPLLPVAPVSRPQLCLSFSDMRFSTA